MNRLFFAIASATAIALACTHQGFAQSCGAPTTCPEVANDPEEPVSCFYPACTDCETSRPSGYRGLVVSFGHDDIPSDYLSGSHCSTCTDCSIPYTNDFERALCDPRVRAIEVRLFWSDLEPTRDSFNFDIIDSLIDDLDSAAEPKQLVLAIIPTGTPEITPAWFFEDAAEFNYDLIYDDCDPNSIKYPCFWDAGFQAEWEEMINSLAAEYEGNTHLAYIKTTGWSVGTLEPQGYWSELGTPLHNLAHSIKASDPSGWSCTDFDPDITGCESGSCCGHATCPVKIDLRTDDPWATAAETILSMWDNAFCATRLAAVVKIPLNTDLRNDGYDAFIDSALSHHMMMMSNGLSEEDHTCLRQYLCAWYTDSETTATIGWSAVSGGAVTDPMKFAIEATGAPYDSPLCYDPLSHASYVTVGVNFIANTANNDAITWILNHLDSAPALACGIEE